MYKYKYVAPEDTIANIQNILSSHNFEIAISRSRIATSGIYSCSTILNGINELSTNGKGASTEYALASSLAEMMERLQSLCIFSGKIGVMDEEDFYGKYPGNIVVSNYSRVEEVNSKHLGKFDTIISENGLLPSNGKQFVIAPFYSVFDKENYYFPINKIMINAGSNGLCAGNRPAEAISQGICELLERISLLEMFKGNNHISLIPAMAIKSEWLLKTIHELEKSSLSIKIFDLSFGMSYPTVGVLLYKEASNLFKFSLGTHLILDYAISRAITENFQGFSMGEYFQAMHEIKDMDDVPSHKLSYWHSDWTKGKIYTKNYIKSLVSGDGNIPYHLWTEQRISNLSSWKNVNELSDDKDMLYYLLKIIRRNNLDVYIHDNSILGFNTYRVFLSKETCISSNPWDTDDLSTKVKTIAEKYKIENLSSHIRSVFRNKDYSKQNMAVILEYLIALKKYPSFIGSINMDWMKSIWLTTVPDDAYIQAESLIILFSIEMELYKLALIELKCIKNDRIGRYKDRKNELTIIENYLVGKINGRMDDEISAEEIRRMVVSLFFGGVDIKNRSIDFSPSREISETYNNLICRCENAILNTDWHNCF